jgi:hypothetical protein
MPAFAPRLGEVREAKGVSPYRLAQLTGLSKQGVLNLGWPAAPRRCGRSWRRWARTRRPASTSTPEQAVHPGGPSLPATT